MSTSRINDTMAKSKTFVITPHSIAQMQNLLDSLDATSKSSKDDLLSFFVQSIFPSPGTNTRSPLVRNISTRDGNRCLVKDQWAAPSDVHPKPTSIHLRFVFPLELIKRRISDWSNIREFLSAFCDITEAHAQVSMHCNWLHGDITPMNVLVDRNGKGVLTDWDHQIGKQEY